MHPDAEKDIERAIKICEHFDIKDESCVILNALWETRQEVRRQLQARIAELEREIVSSHQQIQFLMNYRHSAAIEDLKQQVKVLRESLDAKLREALTLRELREKNETRARRWCGDELQPLDFAMMELAGEVGEACNKAKKLARLMRGWPGGEDTRDGLKEELADVVICADLAAMVAGIDLDTAVAEKFNATSEKHGFPERLAAALDQQDTPHRPIREVLDSLYKNGGDAWDGVALCEHGRHPEWCDSCVEDQQDTNTGDTQ